MGQSGKTFSDVMGPDALGTLCEKAGDGGGDEECGGSKWALDIATIAGPKSSDSLLALLGQGFWFACMVPQFWIHGTGFSVLVSISQDVFLIMGASLDCFCCLQ